MPYDELIKELCDVIKESESNSIEIYDNLELIESSVNNFNLLSHEKNKINKLISKSYGILQNQDLHRQKIEKVVNHVSKTNNIDISHYNIASSAVNIGKDSSSDMLSDDELEALIKSMAN